MKKYLYVVFVSVFLLLTASVFLFAKEDKVLKLKNRQGPVAISAEWLNAKKAIESLLEEIEKNPGNYKARLKLAEAYIQEGRETGDHAYYDKAVLDLLKTILKKDPQNFEALCCKATVLLSQHHFAEGLEVGKQAVVINPDAAFAYGILCDGYVETGNYDEAVKMADKMVSVRPDLRSYARVSYLREIYGKTKGAIEAMKMAVDAGYPGLEQTEWVRTQLGHLYENDGNPDKATELYLASLQYRPGYAYALAGMGRVEKTKKNYRKAVMYYELAAKQIPDAAFDEELVNLYLVLGEKEKSIKAGERVIVKLSPGKKDESEGHGHYADKELAYAYLELFDIDKALKHAQIEYERRPENIDVCEMMAWVRYKRGEFAQADEMITKALRTNSQNPVLLSRAGLIRIKAGKEQEGKSLIKKAFAINPFIPFETAWFAKPYLS